MFLYGSGCLGSSSEEEAQNALRDNENIIVHQNLTETVDGATISKEIYNDPTDEEKELDPVTYVDNSALGDKLSIVGTVTGNRFEGREVPQYVLNFTLQDSSASEPVAYDTLRIDFDPGDLYGPDLYTVFCTESASDSYMGRVLKPGQTDPISIDTANYLPKLQETAENGKIAVHISAYYSNTRVAAFHAVLPANLTDGETQMLFFREFKEVEKEVDRDFNTRYIWYSDPAKNTEQRNAAILEEKRLISLMPLGVPNVTKLDKVSISGIVVHNIGGAGSEQWRIQVNVTPVQNVTYNSIKVAFEDSKRYTPRRLVTREPYRWMPEPKVTGPGDKSLLVSFFSDNDAPGFIANSTTGKVGIHIMVYNDDQLVGAEHAVLPTIFATGGQAPELPLGQSAPLRFASFEEVRNAVDKK